MKPMRLHENGIEILRARLANLDAMEIRVLASLLFMVRDDIDTSDLNGLPALLDKLTAKEAAKEGE